MAFIPIIYFQYSKVLIAGRNGSRIFGLSLLAFTSAAINDALNYSYLIDTPNLIHIGTLAFVIFQLADLVNNYLKTFKTIEDMSATLKIQNRELQFMDEYKDEFLATTSHELRTPLHSITGLTALIKRDDTTLSDAQTQKLDMINATSRRLNNLVNDILDASSIKHGKLKLNIGVVNIPLLLKITVESMQPLLSGQAVTLTINSDDALAGQGDIYAIADEQRVQQILINLISNAIKFTEVGEVEVSYQAHDSKVHISIKDTGLGIPEYVQDKLFQPFESYLQNQGKDKRFESTGLGLSICKQLTELQNGELVLRSQEGKGTVVSFTLPQTMEKTDANKTQPKTQLQTNHPFASSIAKQNSEQLPDPLVKFGLIQPKPLVYYADDEAVNREVLKSLLFEEQINVLTFSNAKELIQKVAEQEPDLILLDLMMPGMHGIDACLELRKEHHAAELPIIMLTARHQISDITEALTAGANDYLTKPYNEQELLARIHGQLSVRQLWQAQKENQQLKEDLASKELLKQTLEKTNLQLQQAVDLSTEALIVITPELYILHSNKAASLQFDTPETVLIEENLSEFLNQENYQLIENLLINTQSDKSINISLNELELIVSAHKIESDKSSRPSFILTFQNTNTTTAPTQIVFDDLVKELGESRRRIEHIESAIGQLTPLTSQDETIQTDSETLASPDQAPLLANNELIVKTMRLSLSAWERYTHLSKVDLAEKSHCWNVYLDGTTAKTRTLDKYLSIKTLPSKPRWRSVINTAKFVLKQCQLPEEEQQQLESLAEQLDNAFS